jgi:hypothetical protein
VHQGLELAVRVGVTGGEALVTLAPGGESEAVVGDVVNTASRLQALAPVNGVVVGEGTFQATSRSFGFARLGRVRVKGKAEPLAIWRLLGPRSRTGIDTVRRPDTLPRQTLRRRGSRPGSPTAVSSPRLAWAATGTWWSGRWRGWWATGGCRSATSGAPTSCLGSASWSAR